jgi:hypothetical protein
MCSVSTQNPVICYTTSDGVKSLLLRCLASAAVSNADRVCYTRDARNSGIQRIVKAGLSFFQHVCRYGIKPIVTILRDLLVIGVLRDSISRSMSRASAAVA